MRKLLIFFIFSTSFANTQLIAGKPNLKLLECFEYKKDFWIVGHAFHTSSVQFKDECLRMCLTSSIRRAKCLSAMHVPNDDECVISDQNQITKPDLFIENDSPGTFTVNFFRNICVDPPDSEGASRLEARLQGYQGGEGIFEISQIDGKDPMIMVVISGLKENSVYDVNFVQELNGKGSCRKVKEAKGRNLLTVETDHTGMAVQPWKSVGGFSILEEDIVNKIILIIDKSTNAVVDCGSLRPSQTSNSTIFHSSAAFSLQTGSIVFPLILMTYGFF